MSDFYTPFVQDLIKQIAVVVAVVVVVIFAPKLNEKEPKSVLRWHLMG